MVQLLCVSFIFNIGKILLHQSACMQRWKMRRKGKPHTRGVTGLKWRFMSVVVICRQQNRSYKVQKICQVRSCPPKQNKTGDVIGITYGRSGSTLTWFCLSPLSICNALWDSGHGRCPIFFFFALCIFLVSHIPTSLKAGK